MGTRPSGDTAEPRPVPRAALGPEWGRGHLPGETEGAEDEMDAQQPGKRKETLKKAE